LPTDFTPKRIFIDEEYLVNPTAWDGFEVKEPANRVVSQFPGVPLIPALRGKKIPIPITSTEQSSVEQRILWGKETLHLQHKKSGWLGRFDKQEYGSYCPNFRKLNLGSQCPFQCEYCFLLCTFRGLHPIVTVALNVEDLSEFLERQFEKLCQPTLFNSGELMDPLALDRLTGVSKSLVPFFGCQENARLLLLTKSDEVDNLIAIDSVHHRGHTIVAWSLNCDEVIQRFEHGAATLDQRLEAARRCKENGYPIRFRFDPLLMIEDWQDKYAEMIHKVMTTVVPDRITIGSFRLFPQLRSIISKVYLSSDLLRHDMVKPFVPKVDFSGIRERYPDDVRLRMYQHVINEVRRYDPDGSIPIALCKEEYEMWDKVGLEKERTRDLCNCQV
jgi:spore photoproduct lyase